MARTYNQTPTEKIDYAVNLSGGDLITSSAWTSTASDGGVALTIGTPVTSPDAGPIKTTARISAVRNKITFVVKVHIVGATGQEYDHYFNILGSLEKN